MEFLQFYCCMDLIAATRAEGGLVTLTLRFAKVSYQSLLRPKISLSQLVLLYDFVSNIAKYNSSDSNNFYIQGKMYEIVFDYSSCMF